MTLARPGERARVPLTRSLRALTGRDQQEHGRTASPLELLFDLAFAVSFSIAGAQFAHLIARGHILAGLVGFAFCMFAIVWAWVAFAWFASAYDTDDWLYRVTTMTQMVGVVVLALGIPALFASLEHGAHLDNFVIVMGYVVMRLAMVAHWMRAWRDDPAHRKEIRAHVLTAMLAQVGWVWTALVALPVQAAIATYLALIAIELLGPVIGETRGRGIPWHAHHITERYSLLTIITLGEGVIGTVATLSASVGEQGWGIESVLVVVAGIGLTFGMWWVYFMTDSATLLSHHRNRSFGFGYLHIPLFGSIVAVGAGLHVAGYVIAGESQVSTVWAVASVVIPLTIYIGVVYTIHLYLARETMRLQVLLLALSGLMLGVALLMAGAGVSLGWCLVMTMFSLVVHVAGFEAWGQTHRAEVSVQQPEADSRS